MIIRDVIPVKTGIQLKRLVPDQVRNAVLYKVFSETVHYLLR